jgi:acyl carrier protein
LHRTIAQILGVSTADIDDSSSPEQLSTWDSLNHLNLVMALEQEFAISLSVEDALEMRTVGSIRSVLARHGIDC